MSKLFETHVQYDPTYNIYVVRSQTIDGKNTEYFHRSLKWLKKYANGDIPYDWSVVKANPDKWFLL